MKIAVVGVGAMGSVYAALLADAGNEVSAIDVSPSQISAIRAHGLRVEGASGDRVVRLHATGDPAEVGPVDLVVIATKAMHARAAAESTRPLLGPETVVLPIQNGLGSSDAVAEVVGADRVVVGVAGGFGASVISPGHAHHHGLELVRLGELTGTSTPRLERISETWRAAGFTVAMYDDIGRLVWEKLICNVAFSGPCAVLDATIGDVLENEHAWSIASTCAVEAFDVAVAGGIALGFDDPVAYVTSFGKAIGGARPSLALDLRAGRLTEIDAINGAIPPRAAELGLAAPCNTTIVALVRALQARRAYSESRA
ncbi:MAG TPA: 2-dehydropantoate 2-reductase [Gaiellaceae bacterium]|nr:2-dehydropantoate 2-reductase [Gaiellaceae bacterium]